MEKAAGSGAEGVKRSRSRSPRPKRPSRRGGRWRRFNRSRSPLGDNLSSDTQRSEAHLKRGRIFVGNIDPITCKRKDLTDTFSRYGDVIAVSIHNGYAFVQMDSEKSANSAINLEHGRTMNGQKINVEFSSAAIKAGAKFQRVSLRSSRSPPPRHHPAPPRSLPPPPSASRFEPEPDMMYLEQERRIAHIMALENELRQEMSSFQRDRLDYDYGGYYSSSKRGLPSDYPPPSASASSYSRPSLERSSRDLDRGMDIRPKPTRGADYYDPLPPPTQAPHGSSMHPSEYPSRAELSSSLYTRSSGGSTGATGYGRSAADWETSTGYPSAGGYLGGNSTGKQGPW